MILSYIQEDEKLTADSGQLSPEKTESEQDIPGSPLDYTFETRYLQFKEKIAKDRMAWETIAKQK